jgi:rSAM/selenodomain-associated transferase 1
VTAEAQLLVLAKAPVPGRVKTRLCPPCTPVEAARLAAAALADTLDALGVAPAAARTLVLDGAYRPPAGWRVVPQRGDGLGERLASAFADTARPGMPAVLVGMDTPQLTADLLAEAAATLTAGRADAVLGPAEDGGWWALGLTDSAHAAVLPGVPMSTATTGADTLAALRRRGLRVALLPTLRDVDTVDDAFAVLPACPPGGRFPAAVAEVAEYPRPMVGRP